MTKTIHSLSGLRLHCGSAATVLAEHYPAGSVDMVYADPPFGNRQIWTGKAGRFSDRWTEDVVSGAGWAALLAHNPAGHEVMTSIATSGHSRGYLGMMAGVVVQLRRVLRLTGTLWLHFDDSFGAELRVLCDMVFGPDHPLGTLIWKRTSSHNARGKGFGRVHDTVACYARSRVARWKLWRLAADEPLFFGDPATGPTFVGGLLEERLNSGSRERVGYPTQKPVSLIRRFVRAATDPGDVVLDPTCGSGSTLVAAHQLGRHAIGIDLSVDAIAATRDRLPALPTDLATLDLTRPTPHVQQAA